MAKAIFKEKKAIALFIVIASLLIVLTLANVILSIISSQSRLTHHQVGRIQAHYAALAGVNFAFEKLRNGTWAFTPTNSCRPGYTDCLISDSAFPSSVTSVNVIFCPRNQFCAGNCTPPATSDAGFCVQSTATYSFTQ